MSDLELKMLMAYIEVNMPSRFIEFSSARATGWILVVMPTA